LRSSGSRLGLCGTSGLAGRASCCRSPLGGGAGRATGGRWTEFVELQKPRAMSPARNRTSRYLKVSVASSSSVAGQSYFLKVVEGLAPLRLRRIYLGADWGWQRGRSIVATSVGRREGIGAGRFQHGR
jgi:hypothetical protein